MRLAIERPVIVGMKKGEGSGVKGSKGEGKVPLKEKAGKKSKEKTPNKKDKKGEYCGVA